MSVLVTGAAGFVGRRLCARLHALGAHVTAVVRRAETASRLVEVPRITVGDVTDADRMREVFEETRPRRVFHLAAKHNVSQALDDLPAFVHANVFGTACILAAAEVTRPERVVVMGTAAECGPDAPVPMPDDFQPRPANPYGISKALATQLCADAWRVTRLPVCVARGFLLYGPEMGARYFLQQLLDAAREERTLDMTQGEQTRDFLHVDDAVEGLIAASGSAALDGLPFNLCTGVEISLQEIAKLCEKVTGRQHLVRLGAVPYRRDEIFRYVGDARRLREATGWTARIALEDGLRALWSGSGGSTP